jgi:hypothetical protein
MTDEQHIHELIDQYLMGELVGQDLDKFKIRLKDDPEFLKQVQLQKAIIQSLELNRQAELKAMLKERTSKSRGIIPLNGRLLAVAASVISLVALGLVLKYVIGFGPNESQLSTEEKASDTIQEKVVETQPEPADTAEFVAVDSNENQQEVPVPITELDSGAQYVVAEVEVADEDVEESRYLTEDTDDTDLAKLRKDEEELDGKKFSAQRDTMLGSTSVILWAVNVSPVITQSDVSQTTQGGEPEKKTSISLRRKNKEKTEDVDAEKDEGIKVPAQPIRQQVKSIRVEFWHSIVNFKGYKYDGTKLLLFDTPKDAKLTLTQLDGNVYLNKNGSYYRIIANNSFNQLRKVTDSTVINTLNQK